KEQWNLDVDRLIDLENNGSQGLPVSGSARFNPIRADRQQRDHELAVRARLRGATPVCLLFHDVHFGVGEGFIRSVGNSAHDRAPERLRTRRPSRQKKPTKGERKNGAKFVPLPSVAWFGAVRLGMVPEMRPNQPVVLPRSWSGEGRWNSEQIYTATASSAA